MLLQNFQKFTIRLHRKSLILLLVLFIVAGANTSFAQQQGGWAYEGEAEAADIATVGRTIWRSNASASRVHGQFGCSSNSWAPADGYVEYVDIDMPQTDHLLLTVRYSKNTTASVPISVYIDGDLRGSFMPQRTWSWNEFAWSEQVDLGVIDAGLHSLRFRTMGQQYCVADLDLFTLSLPWQYEREAEIVSSATTGRVIPRSNASASQVLGQFGCTQYWSPQSGFAEYTVENVPASEHLYLQVRYSKNTVSTKSIDIFLDGLEVARFTPASTGDWNSFALSEEVDLGAVDSGSHTIRLYTEGQLWCVADLDTFILKTVSN